MPSPLFSGPFARVTLANFFFFLNFASFFLLPLYVRQLGGTEGTVGAVMGTQGLASLAVLPAVGIALDRFGRRRFFVFGTVGMTLAALGYRSVEAIGPALFALRLLQGLSFAAAFTASTTLAAELAPRERRAEALGLFGISTLLTHALAPTIGEEVVRRAGFGTLFLGAAFFSTLPLLLLPGVPARRRPETRHTGPAFRMSRLQWTLIATMTFAGMGFGAVVTFVPTFVRAEGLGRVGSFFAAYTVAAILTRVAGAHLSDSFGRRRVVLPALVVLSISILGLAFARSVIVLIGTGAVFGAGHGIAYPTLHAFLVDLTPPLQLGRSQAFFNGSFNLGVLSSAFLFGQVADAVGQRPMFAFAALMPFVAAALLYGFGTAPPEAPSGNDAGETSS